MKVRGRSYPALFCPVLFSVDLMGWGWRRRGGDGGLSRALHASLKREGRGGESWVKVRKRKSRLGQLP